MSHNNPAMLQQEQPPAALWAQSLELWWRARTQPTLGEHAARQADMVVSACVGTACCG